MSCEMPAGAQPQDRRSSADDGRQEGGGKGWTMEGGQQEGGAMEAELGGRREAEAV